MKMTNKKSVLAIFLYIGGYFEIQCSIYQVLTLIYIENKKKYKAAFIATWQSARL